MTDFAERYLFSAAAGAMVLLWLFLAMRRAPETPSVPDVVVLRYGAFLKMFAWIIALGIPGLLIWVMMQVPLRSPHGPLIVGGGVLGLAILGGLLLIETARVRIAVTDEGIQSASPWRRERVIPWQQVSKVSFSMLNRWFLVTSIHGTTIRVSVFLKGVREFAARLKQRLPPERYAGAERGFTMI